MAIIKGPYQYTADNGDTFTVVIDQAMGAQAALGFGSAQVTDPKLKSNDRSFRMRVALVVNSSGKKRRIPCGSKTATAYVTAGTTLHTYNSRDDTQLDSITYGYEGERRIFAVPSAPTQGA